VWSLPLSHNWLVILHWLELCSLHLEYLHLIFQFLLHMVTVIVTLYL
jgi:hypothetical protein